MVWVRISKNCTRKRNLHLSRAAEARHASPLQCRQIRCLRFVTATLCLRPTGQFAFWTSGGKNITSAAAKDAPQISLSALLLNLWLARFVVEARRADGDPYPPTTIVNLLSKLYRFAKNCDRHCPNFMDR